jgi:hypothetical protein
MSTHIEAIKLAKECGATTYKNRHYPGTAVTFGPIAWEQFCKKYLAAPVQETPFQIGQRLRQEGKGISDLWGAVGSDADMPEAQRGFDHAEQPEPVPAARTDQQIVDQTEELAVWLLSWCFNHQPETDTPMRESTHPFAERCWAAACHIQEMLTATDPENSVAELDVDDTPPAAPAKGGTP